MDGNTILFSQGICSLLFGNNSSGEWNKYLHNVPTLHHQQLPILNFQCAEGAGRGGERAIVCSHIPQTTGSKSKSFSSEYFAWVHTIQSLAGKQGWQPSLGMLLSLPGTLFWALALTLFFFFNPVSFLPPLAFCPSQNLRHWGGCLELHRTEFWVLVSAWWLQLHIRCTFLS